MSGPITAAAAPHGAASAQPVARPDDRLRSLAHRVRRLGLAGRFDLEAAFIERDEIFHALSRLARELDRAPPPPRPAPRLVTLPGSERLLARLAAMTREIGRLQALLAAAARPRPRRQHRPSTAQLSLPLLETCNADQ